MREKIFILIICVINIFLCHERSYAYSLNVHEKITEKTIDLNASNLNTYIYNYTGLSKGINAPIFTKTVRKWIESGSRNEDYNWQLRNNPLYSHFYNPLTNSSGVGEFWYSAYDWANVDSNQWSWQKARDYLYYGIVPNPYVDMKLSLVKAFEGLGHMVHLVEDMAVPAHTRGDLHVSEPYENYTNMTIGYLAYDTPFYFPYWNLAMSQGAPKQFWDVDSYTVTPYTGDYMGLAEYTNENFFSDNTIFNNFAYPDWATIVEYSYFDTNGNNRIYLKKLGYAEGGYSESINHLAAGKWFYKYIPSFLTSLKKSSLMLDDKCFNDYQQKLIPRAVGYSAGLLDYFFRGALEITPPAQVAYAVTDGSQTPYIDTYEHYHQQFTSIKANIRNTTLNDAMTAGSLIAVAQYKLIPNYSPDLSNYPPDEAVMHSIPFSYSVSAPIALSSEQLGSMNANPTEFTFDFYAAPIPAGITDLKLLVIYKGTLGNEENIAVAVGMKDLMEPTHHVFWNLTDMFSLDNHLRTSNTIRTTPQYADRVDFDHDGILNPPDTGEPYIDPHAMTFGIGYMSTPGPNPFTYSAITVVQPGRHIRLVVLVDKSQDNYMVLVVSDAISGTSYFYNSSPGVINQEENGVWQTPTPMTTFRYGLDGITQIPIRQHFSYGVLRCYPMGGIDPNGNPVCSYPESEAIPADELSPSPIDAVYYSPQAAFSDKLTTRGVSVKDATGQGGAVVK